MKGKSLWKPRSTSPKARANSWSILGKLWTHIQKFKNKFNIFALYQFFFNSLPPSPSYLILFSLLPFLSILFDSYPFSTQLLYIPTSLSLLVLIPISTASLLPSGVLHLFPHLPVLSILFASYPFFHSLSLMPSCNDFHYFLLPSLSLSLNSNNLILFIPIFNSP